MGNLVKVLVLNEKNSRGNLDTSMVGVLVKLVAAGVAAGCSAVSFVVAVAAACCCCF